MTEKNFEDFLEKAAKTYNIPPTRPPREEMWTAIQAARSARPQVIYGGASIAPVLATNRFTVRVWVGAAAAALLLVATGIGIGRFTASPAARISVASTAPLRADPVIVAGREGDGLIPGQSTNLSATNIRDRSGSHPVTERVATTNGENAQTRSGVGRADVVSSVGSSGHASSSAYQMTAVQHLSEAEALLTSFRARSPSDQQMDAQLASWARQLLSNTRLLLDSPVANDPQRRPLLEDLELVLVQIVQLSPGSTAQDRELIEKTLQHDHVMTRLRTAIPAGPQRGS